MHTPTLAPPAPTVGAAELRDDVLLRPEFVHEVIPTMTPAQLYQMRREGRGPQFIQERPGATVWYRVGDLRDWVVSITRDPRGHRPPAPKHRKGSHRRR